MRLLSCRLQNIRVHGDLSLDFGPGLTLIGGPNETGKSTLVEALHRCLFLRATATGTPVEALQSRLHLGQPQVELAFAARGESWTLVKRFSGSSGKVLLRSGGGSHWQGPEAEEQLAELLGVKETLGSRQAGSLLRGRWAHLWVMQGRSGDDLLAQGGAHYDLEALVGQLEQGGGSAMQSPQDQQLASRLDALLAETFTPGRGNLRRQAPLWSAWQALEAAEAAVLQAQGQLADYGAASEELGRSAASLQELQQLHLPGLRQRQQRLQAAATERTRLEAALALAKQQLEPLQLRQQALARDLAEWRQLGAHLTGLGQQALNLETSRERAQAELAQLEQQRIGQEQQRASLEVQRQAITERGQWLQRLVEQARLQADLARLNAQRAQLERQEQARSELQAQLDALPPIDGAALAVLQGLEQARRDADTRLGAMAAGVELLRADLPVTLAGQPLEPGTDLRLSEASELQVGSGVVLRISPGGGQALALAHQQRQQGETALGAALGSLGVANLGAAETLARQRQALEQQLGALGSAQAGALGGAQAVDPTGSQAASQRQAIETRLEELQRELAPLEPQRQAQLQSGQLPADHGALEQLHRQLQLSYAATSGPLRQAQASLAALAQGLEAARQRQAASNEALARLKGERSHQQAQAGALGQRHGSELALAAALHQVEAQVASATRQVGALGQELAAVSGGDGASQLPQLRAQIQQAEAEVLHLIASQAAARQRCQTLGSSDPHGALEQAQAALEQAQRHHSALKRLSDGQLLLRDLFKAAQADLSSRYSEPLAGAINRYLEPLLPAGAHCQLRYESESGFSGLQLQRGQERFSFSELSGGMREQLGTALRLSMADVLKAGHDGCLPLVFDDAFTNADPLRLARLQQMLALAVARGLQVIVLTCDPQAYAGLAGSTVTLAPLAP
jgi:DNA repair exonuclease SbcCD ATPase subunit